MTSIDGRWPFALALLLLTESAIADEPSLTPSRQKESTQTQAPFMPGPVRLRNLVYRRPTDASVHFHLLSESDTTSTDFARRDLVVKSVGYGFGIDRYRPLYNRPWYYGPRAYSYGLYRPWYFAPYRYSALRYRYFNPAYQTYYYDYAPWYLRGYGIPYGAPYWSFSPSLVQLPYLQPIGTVPSPCLPIVADEGFGDRSYAGCYYW